MAEAIGLIASVVQLAGTGLKLSQALYQYADSVANADRRVKEVAKEIKLTSCVIEELGNIFQQDDTLSLISKSAVATANETLKECSALFGEIEITLNKSKKGKMGRLMLPFRENKMELLRNHIDKLKSTLQLLMQVLLHAHQVASNKIDREAEARQRDEIRQLLEEKKNNTKKYEESLRSFAASDSSTEVGDDTSSLDDKESDSMIEIKSIGPTVDPDSLAECMGHVRTLLESMERLQQALSNKSEGDDHSNHQQTAVESYFVTRCHLDRILLGSSNTTNLKDTGLAMRQPTSSKAEIPASDSKPYTIKKGKEEGSIVVEIHKMNARTEVRKDVVSADRHGPTSRKRVLPKQAPPKAEVGLGPPPGTQGPSYSSSHRFSEFESGDFGRHFSRSCPPQITENQSASEPAPAYPNINPALRTASDPLYRAPEHNYSEAYNVMEVIQRNRRAYDNTKVYEEYRPYDQVGRLDENRSDVLPVSHRSGIAVPETINISQVRHSYRSSRDKIHDLDTETRQRERREDTRGGKANDTRNVAPEGNDEVEKLLREWTTCFS